jgi:predicted HicB family RNase H-like nuclease
MNNTLSYLGYLARVEFDRRGGVFVGHVLGLADRISFHGETVPELTSDFHHAVDPYLADCKKTGRTPDKPASGKLMLRVRPDIHAAAAIAAKANGKSLNQWAEEIIGQAAHAEMA